MDYSNNLDESITLYNFLEKQKCLCLYEKSLKSYIEFSKSCFEEYCVSEEKEDSQLLCISTLRLLAETYVAGINKYQKVCKQIKMIFKMLSEEKMFYYMVDIYLKTSYQHLSWSFAKTISVVIYGAELSNTKEWINFILKNSMLQSSDDKCFRLVELISYVVSLGLKASHDRIDDSKCQNLVSCTLPGPKDHLTCICSELALHWYKMVERYTNPDSVEKGKEAAFLRLWRSVIDGPLPYDLSTIFLNKKFILDILRCGNLNRPKVMSLYVEVIIRIINSNIKFRPWKEADCIQIEKSVTTALSTGLLESMPTNDQEFCNAIKKVTSCGSLNMSGEIEDKLCVVGKKIVYILVHLLAEFQNLEFLYESYQKIIAVINQKNILEPFWLLNMFLDDDDLLLGVLLASLRIYKNLQIGSDNRTAQSSIELFLLHDINPHALFLQFLQLLGYDHNELVSFLVSDETCCLLYLTEYLKLLLNEKQQFIKTYLMLVYDKKLSFESIDKETKNKSPTAQNKSSVEQVQCNSICDKDCSGEISVRSIISEGLNNEKEEISKNNCLLVTYSSSSSEDESCDEKENDVKNLLKIILVLKSLREGIQKLVKIKEFPYNITPLLFLLRSCEELFR